jgi:hypothetical protein
MSLETLVLRKEELKRRVDALPAEMESWQDRSVDILDMNVHYSQIQALAVLMKTFEGTQRALLLRLDVADETDFQATALRLICEIIRSQRVWDFFRAKLELRFSPIFKDVLWVADTIAWDCYRPVMDRAVQAQVVPAAEVREPPLSYLTAEFSPATWLRGSRPNDGRNYHLGTSRLPIPVIELPWDHMENLWELVSLHHEVGHDIEGDLKLRGALLLNLVNILGAAGVPQPRIDVWQSWVGEIFADLVAIQQGGLSFSLGLAHLLLLPAHIVTKYNPEDPHPTHYVRVLMNTAYARTLVSGDSQPEKTAAARIEKDAASLEEAWKSLYGEAGEWVPFIADFPAVFQALMDTPVGVLKGTSVRALIPFTAADDLRIRTASEYLLTGQNAPGPQTIAPRHCASAARLAAAKAVTTADLSAALGDINTRLTQLIRDSAPLGLRGADDSTPHQKFISSFAPFM